MDLVVNGHNHVYERTLRAVAEDGTELDRFTVQRTAGFQHGFGRPSSVGGDIGDA